MYQNCKLKSDTRTGTAVILR